MLTVALNDNSKLINVIGDNQQLFDETMLGLELNSDTVVKNVELNESLLLDTATNNQPDAQQPNPDATLTLEEIEKKFYFIISDTLGLVSFAISGALVGLQVEFNFFGVILLALLTAVGGGVMRDILLNRVPVLLTSEFYGTVALLVGTILFVLEKFNYLGFIPLMAVFGCGVALRLLAYYKQWNLPKLGS